MVSRRDRRPDKAPCTFSRNGDKLVDHARQALRAGDTIDIAIEYAGSPDRGMRFILPDPAYPEKPLAIWTQGEAEDTHHWLPCYDYPNDRATTEMIVTVEKPLFVLSNGVLVDTKPGPGNTTTYHWKMDVPFVSYLISLAVADFAVYHDKVGDLPVDYYVAQAGRRGDGAAVHGQDAADDRVLRRGHRPAVSVCQVCPGLHARVRRRHGEHHRHDDDRHGAARRDRRARGERRRPGRRTSWRTSGSATC